MKPEKLKKAVQKIQQEFGNPTSTIKDENKLVKYSDWKKERDMILK